MLTTNFLLWDVRVYLSLSAAALIALYFVIKARRSAPLKLPPGPRGLEALRSVLSALKTGSFNTVAEEWSRRYGELVLCRSLLGDICFLNSARLVRELYASKEHEAVTSARPESFSGWFLQFGYRDVITSGSNLRPEWGKMRKLFHYALKFYGDGMERMERTVQSELQRLLDVLEVSHDQDLDVDSALSNSLFCIIGILLNGEHPEPGLVKLMKQYDKYGNLMMNPITEVTLMTFPWLRFVPLLPYRELCREACQGRDEFVHQILTAAKKKHVSGQPKGMVDIMLDEQSKEENLQWLSDDHIGGLIMNTVGAAFLTSMETIKATFLYLMHEPKVMHRVQKEIDDKIGARHPQIEDKNKLPYTEAVILETLRLSSIVSLGLPHQTLEDLTIDGYTIPKKTMMYANATLFHRDLEVFPNPDDFQPERFLDNKGEVIPVSHPLRQRFVPFGIGKRSCPGENFAKSRVFLYITTLLQKFDILPPVEHPLLPMTRSSWNKGIVMQLQPYYMIFRQRA